MSVVHTIIDAFGGVNATATATGTPQQTVSEWRTRNPPEIPPWRRSSLIDAAQREKVKLPANALAYLASTERTRKSPVVEAMAS
jgi:hypothetical protein